MKPTSTIITIDQYGKILSVDKNCCKIFGYELDEIIGRSIEIIIPSPYKEQHASYLENYRKTKVNVYFYYLFFYKYFNIKIYKKIMNN